MKCGLPDLSGQAQAVAPCAGAGIEIRRHSQASRPTQSPPARGRGLKFCLLP